VSFLRQVRVGYGVALLCGAFATTTPGFACSFAAPDRDEIPISKWVADVDEIVLARVVSSRQRARSEPDVDHENGISPTGLHEFSFETVEQLKGSTPGRFVLNGTLDGSGDQDSASLKHRRLGRFWLYFAPEEGGSDAACQWSPRFAFGNEYLIFRNKNGGLSRWFGRGTQVIPARDDPWLIAIRRLVVDPKLKYGRSATIPEVLASATFVVEVVADRCSSSPPPAPLPPGAGTPPSTAELTGHRIVRQLWGSPVEHTYQLDSFIWLDDSKCRVGERRVAAYFQDGVYDAELLRLAVSDGKVDFTGLVNGTDRGFVDTSTRYGLWYAQVGLPAKLVWATDELAAALGALAAGRMEAGGAN